MNNAKKLLVVFGFIAAMVVLIHVAKEAGIGVNTSGSAPVGIWHKQKLDRIERGALIAFCPPANPIIKTLVSMRPTLRGSCEGNGSIEFIKPVGALPGDMVTLRKNGNVLVNGVEIPNTKASPEIAFPAGEYRVNPNEVWTFSTYDQDSYDSRYFGPVPISRIKGEAKPILVSGDTSNMTRGFEK